MSPADPAPVPAKTARARTVQATFLLAPGPRVVTREATVVGGRGDLLELLVPPQGALERPLHLGLVPHREGPLPTPPFWVEAGAPADEGDEEPRTPKKK